MRQTVVVQQRRITRFDWVWKSIQKPINDGTQYFGKARLDWKHRYLFYRFEERVTSVRHLVFLLNTIYKKCCLRKRFSYASVLSNELKFWLYKVWNSYQIDNMFHKGIIAVTYQRHNCLSWVSSNIGLLTWQPYIICLL